MNKLICFSCLLTVASACGAVDSTSPSNTYYCWSSNCHAASFTTRNAYTTISPTVLGPGCTLRAPGLSQINITQSGSYLVQAVGRNWYLSSSDIYWYFRVIYTNSSSTIQLFQVMGNAYNQYQAR